MNKILTLLTIIFGMTTSATSQPVFRLPKGNVSLAQNLPRRITTNANETDRLFRLNDTAKKTKKGNIRIVSPKEAKKAITDYGTEVVILHETFDKFSTGTLENPDRNVDIRLEEPEYPWTNISPQYTVLPGWGAENVYPAGGAAYLWAGQSEMSHLNTPRINVSGCQGIVIVQFKACAPKGQVSEGIIIEGAETYDMAPTWRNLGAASCPPITDEWQTYEALFYDGGETSIFNIVALEPICIDEIKVYQVDQYVHTPVILPHSHYKGTSFDANWETVNGAESYLLNVYTINEETQETRYILTDQKVEGTSFTVKGTESGATYYYRVRAVKGEHISIESAVMEVFDLEAPVLNPVDELKNGVYTASWNIVPTADVYNYWAYNERVASTNGEFVVTEENFDDVKDAEGKETGWTLENPSYNTYSELYLADLNQAGWKGLNYAPYTHYICLDGWHYFMGNGDAGLISPELDLSKDEGKIEVSVKLYGELVNNAETDFQPMQTQAAIALFNYDETLNDWVQDELIYTEEVEAKWKTFHISLTKGNTRSIIGIYAVTAPGNLFLDDLKITQNYKKGESLVEAFLYKRFYEGNELVVTLPEKALQANTFHKVSAVKTKGGGMFGGEVKQKESEFSSLEQVSKATFINTHSLMKAYAQIRSNKLYIVNPTGALINVCTVNGTLIRTDDTHRKNIEISLPGHDIYIVKIGDEVFKVVY